jgi:hypothetical protein
MIIYVGSCGYSTKMPQNKLFNILYSKQTYLDGKNVTETQFKIAQVF